MHPGLGNEQGNDGEVMQVVRVLESLSAAARYTNGYRGIQRQPQVQFHLATATLNIEKAYCSGLTSTTVCNDANAARRVDLVASVWRKLSRRRNAAEYRRAFQDQFPGLSLFIDSYV
jgi:hypothetical protein